MSRRILIIGHNQFLRVKGVEALQQVLVASSYRRQDGSFDAEARGLREGVVVVSKRDVAEDAPGVIIVEAEIGDTVRVPGEGAFMVEAGSRPELAPVRLSRQYETVNVVISTQLLEKMLARLSTADAEELARGARRITTNLCWTETEVRDAVTTKLGDEVSDAEIERRVAAVLQAFSKFDLQLGGDLMLAVDQVLEETQEAESAVTV